MIGTNVNKIDKTNKYNLLLYTGEELIVDLTSEEVKEEQLHDELYREFIGGVGLGVRLLYKRQPGKVAPLGQQNILANCISILNSDSEVHTECNKDSINRNRLLYS